MGLPIMTSKRSIWSYKSYYVSILFIAVKDFRYSVVDNDEI